MYEKKKRIYNMVLVQLPRQPWKTLQKSEKGVMLNKWAHEEILEKDGGCSSADKGAVRYEN